MNPEIGKMNFGSGRSAMKHANISVLLIEDNPADAYILRQVVREVGATQIKLTHVENLSAGLLKITNQNFDVVLLDLSLPDADGLETLLRTHNHAPNIPIVVLTGLDDQDIAMRAISEGAQDYLVKGQVNGPLLVRSVLYATERKAAMEALQRSEEYYRSLIENALDIIAVLDGSGVVRYGSPSLERLLGYPLGKLTGTSVWLLIHPDDVGHVETMLAVGTKHPGAVQHFECRVRHRNGHWLVLECSGKHFEPGSAVDGYVLNCRDITERKRAEEQLRELNETLRAVIEASPLAIYTVDLEGVVLSWNSAAEQIFGYTGHEIVGTPISMVLPTAEASFDQRLSDIRGGKPAKGVELQACRKDGSTVSVSVWNALVRDIYGNVVAVVEAVADVTDRIRLEERFRQAQKMEAVGRLAGGVAHDFNNMLTVITGYCQLLFDDESVDPGIRSIMQQVLRAADRATGITRQLLAFSRRQMLQPKVLAPDLLIQDMKAMLERIVGETIRLELKLEARDSRIRIDPGSLEQVLVNLVVNARDAMEDKGTLTISTSAFHADDLQAFPEKKYYLLEVTDTGSGMSEETMRHLFEPFFTTKPRGHGTGLGLSTSYGIVKNNNRGEIFVRSELGSGSTFSIYLPLVDEAVEVLPVERTRTAQIRGNESILFTEDRDDVRAVVSTMLRQQGYRVLEANSGQQALRVAATVAHIDLLVTDMIMPGMSGKELADELGKTRPGMRVLFISGYVDTGIVQDEQIDSSANFLQKPFQPEDLARKVREVLDSPVRQGPVNSL